MRRLAALFTILALVSAAPAAAEDAPPLVEAQPLAAGVARLLEALDFLGAPLPEGTAGPLRSAVLALDAAGIQEVLDPQAAFVLDLGRDGRLAARRGPARLLLQEAGYAPVLLKLQNHARLARPLRVSSPQAGPVYAGVAELSLRRQGQLALREGEDAGAGRGRFLDLELFTAPPMSAPASGAGVEYAILLVHSARAGTLEASFVFEVPGAGGAPPARGEVRASLEALRAVRVKLEIRDFDGSPTTARLVFKDRSGRVYPPQPKRLAPDLFFQRQVYRHDGALVLLPPGEILLEASRGPEYRTVRRSVAVAAGMEGAVEVRLERWIHPRDFGFYSGDHHIHAAGCAHYSSPSEGVGPEDMILQVRGEGLNVGCLLTWGPCFDHQRRFFSAAPDSRSDPFTVIKYDIEVSGFGSQALGHVCLLNLRDQSYPGSEGTKTRGWPTWTTPVLRWAKAQGAFTGYAHSASGLEIDPPAASGRLLEKLDADRDGRLSGDEAARGVLPEDLAAADADRDGTLGREELVRSHGRAAAQLPNFAVPEMNGVGAMELCVSTAHGVCDFLSAMDTPRIQEWNIWYHLLNCGFPLKVSGETDFPCMSGTRVGQGRVYVKLGKVERIDFRAFCEGIARGRSYVSDGYAHALEFSVEGREPGGAPLEVPRPAPLVVKARVAFAGEVPLSVAHGSLAPPGGARHVGDTVELRGTPGEGGVKGGERLVELVVNGLPAAARAVPADGAVHDLVFRVEVGRSSWIALRHFPQLHSNPVQVIVGGRPIRAARRSALWCLAVIDRLWDARAQAIAPEEREEAQKAFDEARAIYRRIAAESMEES